MVTRRTFLKISGLLGVGIAFAPGDLMANSAKSIPFSKKGPAMVIDLKRCMGCEACVVACKTLQETPRGVFNTKILEAEILGKGGMERCVFLPTLCHHCADAPCMKACPENAIFRDGLGLVLTDWSRCSGEGSCVEACPIGARYLDPNHGMRSGKCDFCIERLRVGESPACVETCPSRARIFGYLERPQGEFRDYLEERRLYSMSVNGPNRGRVFYAGYEQGPFSLSRL